MYLGFSALRKTGKTICVKTLAVDLTFNTVNQNKSGINCKQRLHEGESEHENG